MVEFNRQTGGRSAAVKSFDKFAVEALPKYGHSVCPTFDELTEEGLCNIRLFQLFGGFLVTLSSKAEAGEERLPSGLRQTMINFKNAAFQRFPDNMIWKNEDEWYSPILKDIFDLVNRDWFDKGIEIKEVNVALGPVLTTRLNTDCFSVGSVKNPLSSLKSI